MSARATGLDGTQCVVVGYKAISRDVLKEAIEGKGISIHM